MIQTAQAAALSAYTFLKLRFPSSIGLPASTDSEAVSGPLRVRLQPGTYNLYIVQCTIFVVKRGRFLEFGLNLGSAF